MHLLLQHWGLLGPGDPRGHPGHSHASVSGPSPHPPRPEDLVAAPLGRTPTGVGRTLSRPISGKQEPAPPPGGSVALEGYGKPWTPARVHCHSEGTLPCPSSSASTMFEMEWRGRRVALKASNGRYVCMKKNGQLAAISDLVGEHSPPAQRPCVRPPGAAPPPRGDWLLSRPRLVQTTAMDSSHQPSG